jgi:uncharacterized phiE125 gp8 family phage protein
MGRNLITAPAVEPLTLQEAKDWMRIDAATEDALIEVLIPAARRWAEGYARRALITQTWDLVLDCFPVNPVEILLPMPTLQSVTSINYIDTAGASQLLDPAAYQVDTVGEPGRIAPAFGTVWPQTREQLNAVTIRFVAGYGVAAQDVPEGIRNGMLMLIAHMFERRESTVVGATATKVPMSAEWLVDPYRVLRFG